MNETLRQVAARLELSRTGRFFVDTARGVRGLISGFRGESLTLRAGNLTFITITSLVPVVAVALALVQYFRAQQLEAALKSFVRDLLAPGVREQSDQLVDIAVSATASRTVGTLSFVVLLFSAGILLRHLDASLNEVWAVRTKRRLSVSISLYAGLLFFGPIVMGATLTGTRLARRLFLGAHVPYSAQLVVLGSTALAVVLFTLLYKLAPHAPVRWRSALAGGLVAGICWDVLRHTYSSVASLAFSANPVYGSLGVAPLFLMWVYVSWLVVLFGARLSYAVEHATYRGAFLDILMHPRARELVAARIAQLTSEAFLGKRPAPTAKSLAARLRMPAQTIDEVVEQLVHAGLLQTSKKGELSPSRDPSLLTLADVSAAVGGLVAAAQAGVVHRAEFEPVEVLFNQGDAANIEKLREVTWASLSQKV